MRCIGKSEEEDSLVVLTSVLCHRSFQTRVGELRQHAASVMKSNQDDYLPFLTNNEGDMLSQAEFEEYCAKLLKPGVWGGHPEVREMIPVLTLCIQTLRSLQLVAISTHYQRPIEVLQADAAPIMIGEQFLGRAKPLTIT